MAKSNKETEVNLLYINQGQAKKTENIDDIIKRKRAKERERRIQENKEREAKEFDIETEAVIQMTNRNKIKQEEDKRKKISQVERVRQKRNKRIKFILKIVLLVGIVIGGTIFAMVSPIFNTKDIQVEGSNQIPKDTVISLSGIITGENIFRFSSLEAIKNIKTNAYIENVKIHRHIPNVVEIDVEERIHEYSMDFLGKYAYINNQGYVLEIAEDSKQKPILQGMSTPEEQVIVGSQLNDEDLTKLEDVFKIMHAVKEYGMENKITSIDISNKNEYSIYIDEEKKRAYLGDCTNLSNKILYVNSIIEQEKGKAGEIFINGDLTDGFKAYFRESLNV